MKIFPLLFAGSLAANVALAGFYFTQIAPLEANRDATVQMRIAVIEANRVAANSQLQAARDAASRAKLWSTLNSDDLPMLIARLRAAGFPASVIRAVVSARIQKQFSGRMDALAKTVEDTPFWRQAPNLYYNSKVSEERNQIYRDRAKLLRELLGSDFLASANGEATANQRRQFGELPKSKIDLVQRINDDYAEMASQARAATQGIMLPEDRAKLALLDREKRADLAAILTPQELEDYDRRSSPTTTRLRTALTWMDASETEFRTIFQIQQQFAEWFSPQGGYSSSATYTQRRDADQQMNAQIKAALGDVRAADFARASNYEYQQLAQVAQRENLPLTVAAQAFDVRNTTSQESLRISKDTTLDDQQKLDALKTLAQTARAQLVTTLGPNAGAAYGKSASWLQAIEAGATVTFEGAMTSIRVLPHPKPTAPHN